MDENTKKLIREEISRSFVKKIGDTPNDALQLVNRKYVNLNGTLATRPVTSIIGQTYFDTTNNIPMTYSGSNWVNGVGSVVALNK